MKNRRHFLKTSALAGGGLLLSFVIPDVYKRAAHQSTQKTFTPNAFLRIDADNTIHVILSKVEMGQGIWTTLPMLIAEELDCDLRQVKVEHSPASKEYYHTFIPHQATVGSTSTLSEFDRYRKAGATARVMLVQAAAKRFGVQSEACRTENGYVLAGEKRISYGEVCSEAATMAIPEVALREPKDWKYIGRSQPRLDRFEKVNGQAQYGIDFHAPGLLTAALVRGPGFRSKVKSLNATKAKQISGVRDVVEIPAGVAVLADNYWSARQGCSMLQIVWDPGEHPQVDTKEQIETYRKLSKTKGVPIQQKGDATTALSTAATTLEAEYWVPYLAHAPMEPLNCAVKISADGCEIWTGTQLPTFDQAAAAKLLGMQPSQITIHTPFLGGSFGRRGSLLSDWVVEAVQIAKASGKFIKLIWSREDDIKGGYYRPAYMHRTRIGLDAAGFPTAWEHRIVGQNVFKNTPAMPDPNAPDESSVEGVQGSPYLQSIPDHTVELHATELNVPVLPWRSVGKSHTCFVMESLIDEIAVMNKKDPLAFRMTLLKDHPRYLSVLNLVAEKSGWASPLTGGRSRGVAVYDGNGSYIAYVVEASVADRKIKVHRVVCAIDCGLAVNPDGVRAQMESSIVFGLTAALYGEITFEKGQVKQQNFNDYRMLRISETPSIEVHIVSSTEKMGGAGEPGVPPLAPALTNALFSATGKRVRKLPIRIEDLI